MKKTTFYLHYPGKLVENRKINLKEPLLETPEILSKLYLWTNDCFSDWFFVNRLALTDDFLSNYSMSASSYMCLMT